MDPRKTIDLVHLTPTSMYRLPKPSPAEPNALC